MTKYDKKITELVQYTEDFLSKYPLDKEIADINIGDFYQEYDKNLFNIKRVTNELQIMLRNDVGPIKSFSSPEVQVFRLLLPSFDKIHTSVNREINNESYYNYLVNIEKLNNGIYNEYGTLSKHEYSISYIKISERSTEILKKQKTLKYYRNCVTIIDSIHDNLLYIANTIKLNIDDLKPKSLYMY